MDEGRPRGQLLRHQRCYVFGILPEDWFQGGRQGFVRVQDSRKVTFVDVDREEHSVV